jgi:DNA-dependent RNA polymerase auxiliary subunit epsilon
MKKYGTEIIISLYFKWHNTINEATNINAKYYSIEVIEVISNKRKDIEKELRALYRLKLPNIGPTFITDKLKGSTLFICTTTNDNTYCGGAVVKIIEDKCWILLLASTRTKCGIGETLILNICRHYQRDIYVESDPTAKNFYANF